MKKFIWISYYLNILFLLSGCKTKTVTKYSSFEEDKSEYKNKTSLITNEAESTYKKEANKTHINNNSEENKEEFDIEGETEIDKPFEMQLIENGNFKKSIKISGKAKFKISTNEISKSDILNEKKETSSEDKQKKTTDSKLNESGASTNSKKKEDKTKKTKTSGFQFGAYASVIIWGSIVIVLAALFIYLRKTELFKKIFKITNDDNGNN